MTPARWLAVLLLAYLALDFANPLMPGAVSFDPDDSVEAVRGGHAPAPDAVSFVGEPLVPAVVRAPPPRCSIARAARATRTPRERLAHLRRAPAPSATPARSSEDH